MNSSISLLASKDSLIIVLIGSFSLFNTNFTSFLLKEIDPLLCLWSLSVFASLLIIYIPSSTSLFISFCLLFKETSFGILLELLSITYCASLYESLSFELIRVFPNHSFIIKLFLKVKTAEKAYLSSLGFNEHKLFEISSGSIGTTLSTK